MEGRAWLLSLPTAAGFLPLLLFGCAELGTEVDASAPPRDASLNLGDVRRGEAIVELDYIDSQTGKTVAIRTTTSDVRILYDQGGVSCPPGWGLRVGVQHPDVPHAFAPHIWFKDSDLEAPSLQPGEAGVAVLSVDIPAIETAGRVDNPEDARVVISAAEGMLSSGRYTGDVRVETHPYIPTYPEGPTFIVRSVAFRDIPTDRGANGECRKPPVQSDCVAVHDGMCFRTVEDACQHACERTDCDVLLSNPAQVSCPRER